MHYIHLHIDKVVSKQHLQLLALLAETFRPAFVEELAQLADPAQIAQKITQKNMVK